MDYPKNYDAGFLHFWVLAQRDVWVNIDGEEFQIPNMPLDYLLNVMGYLERKGSQLYMDFTLNHMALLLQAKNREEVIQVRDELAKMQGKPEEDPTETILRWVRSLPVYQSISQAAVQKVGLSV